MLRVMNLKTVSPNVGEDELYEACKVCNSRCLKHLYTSKRLGLPIVRCVACGLTFVGKVVSKEEQLAIYSNQESYRAFAATERSVPEVSGRHLEWLAQIQSAAGLPGGRARASQGMPRLLDIGCGAGDFLAAAAQHGFEIHGMDVSAAAAELAAEWHGIHVDVRQIDDDPRDNFFDVVTLIGVLEHVLDPKSTLAHAHRLLAPSGIMFVYTPVWGAYDALASFAARATGGSVARPIDRRINMAHLQILSKRTITTMLQEHGMTMLKYEAVCEYNLPIRHYLQSLGIISLRCQSAAAALAKFLIDRKLFFRNNMRVLAQKAQQTSPA